MNPSILMRSVPGPLDLAAWAEAAAGEHHLVWLDGDGGRTPRGRWSFLTWNPHRTLRVYGHHRVTAEWHQGRAVSRDEGRADPLLDLDAALGRESVPPATAPSPPASDTDDAVPWISGAIVALSFELADSIERQEPLLGPLLPRSDPFGVWPDLAVACFDSVLALDEVRGRLWLAARLPADRPPSGVLTTFERTRAAAAARARAVEAPRPPLTPPARLPAPAKYRAQVAEIQAQIAAGDVYQVNLSRPLRGTWPGAPLTLYHRHRTLGRVPHGAFVSLGSDLAVASFTPERFLRKRGHTVETSPIKGTRPRRSAAAADRREIEALRSSAKDRAEHLMIVDLERNDLGRVCVPGSIQVEPLFGVESFASVHHLVSTVRGTLRPEVTPLALLRATFPGGSVTGAPKIRAIDVIRHLEIAPRHLYTGALGYWDAGGDMDLALPIRTALLAGAAVEYRVGGGIVIDSDPDAEWRETEDKARAFMQVLAQQAIPLATEERR